MNSNEFIKHTTSAPSPSNHITKLFLDSIVPDSYFDTASFKDFNFVVREKPIGTRHHTKAKTSINISSH